jgi:hypothetical protein
MLGSAFKCGLLLGLGTVSAFAQTIPDATVAAALRSLSDRAGVVFAGEVSAVRKVGGVVEVHFSVDQNIKGQATGGVVLREWAGLWAAGQRRYWVGERAVVFLHDAGKSGLSSSVDGMEGILPLTLAPDSTASTDAVPSLLVDVQRLRTRVLREAGAPMVDASPQMTLAEVALVVNPPPAGPQPIAPPINVPIGRPIPPPVHDPIRFPSPNSIAEPSPWQALPTLVMVPGALDDLDLDDEPKTSTPKKITPPGTTNATY